MPADIEELVGIEGLADIKKAIVIYYKYQY